MDLRLSLLVSTFLVVIFFLMISLIPKEIMRLWGRGMNMGRFIYILDSSSSTVLVQSHFELVSSVLTLEANEPVSEPVTQMAVELIEVGNICFLSPLVLSN